jgi:hypothetical protein
VTEGEGEYGGFQPGEFVLLYSAFTVSSAFAGSDLLQNLTPVLVHPFWFATPENGWATRILPHIPVWFAPRGKHVLEGYYTGSNVPPLNEIVGAWLVPGLVWGGFLLLLAFMMLCLNTLLRRQWAEAERLGFPVIQLPVLMARQRDLGALFSDRMLLVGAAVPVVLEGINVWHAFNPAVPYIPLGLTNIGERFTDRPWSALARWPPLWISWFPFGFGLAFFLPLDLAFSAWFFYLARRGLDVLGAAFGWDLAGSSMARFPFIREQASGAWIGLFLLTVWGGRRQFAEVFRYAFSKRSQAGPDPFDDEPMSARAAVYGLIGGFVALVAFSSVAGLAAWVAALFFLIYFVLQVTMTRIRAQLGPPALELFFVEPSTFLIELIGSRAVAPGGLTVLSYFFWFNRCYRCQPMAHQLESFQMAKALGAPLRPLAGWLMGAAFLGIAFGMVAVLNLYYNVGQASAKVMTYRTGVGAEAFNRLDSWIQNPKGPDAVGLGVVGLALMGTLGLGALRDRFLGFPLHPIGYAFATCFAMEYFWFIFFVTWAVKSLIVRYGGVKLYRTALPFFLGLLLGDSLMGFAVGVGSWMLGWHGGARY